MPIYEYECEKCGNKFETLSKYDSKKIEKCPKCKGNAHRIFSPVPIIFKGEGFYTTDSRKNKETKKSDVKKEEKKESINSSPSTEGVKEEKKANK